MESVGARGTTVPGIFSWGRPRHRPAGSCRGGDSMTVGTSTTFVIRGHCDSVPLLPGSA